MARTDDEIRVLAQEEYTEFCNIVEGMPYKDLDKWVKDNGLTYGTLKPEDNEGLVDINYKHLNVTVADDEGKCFVNFIVEIYNDDDEEIDYDPAYSYPCLMDMPEEEKKQLEIEQLLG